ncbi:MAG TPA: DUF159 family protein [Cytophagales bacterium]|nr:DUF159 family protein [Cytophagales bacterium]HCR53870.1 DUF159 family protein [Cytophagales bacterium]
MFERYSISASAQQLSDRFSVDVPKHYKSYYNAGPTHLLPVITHHNPEGVSFFYWGAIPQWTKDKNVSEKLINIRAEVIQDKPAFKKKMMRFRCIAPIDGFYCWKKISKKAAVPYRFFLKNKGLMAMAALWEEFEDENEETHHTFSVITTKANSQVRSVNERMPLLLNKETEKIWLNEESSENELLKLLTTESTQQLDSYTVSHRISILTANESTLMLPSAPSDQFGNLTLFD